MNQEVKIEKVFLVESNKIVDLLRVNQRGSRVELNDPYLQIETLSIVFILKRNTNIIFIKKRQKMKAKPSKL